MQPPNTKFIYLKVFLNEQRKFDIDNHNVVISVTTGANNKKLFQTIYKEIYENNFKKSEKFTEDFLQMCKAENNVPHNITK